MGKLTLAFISGIFAFSFNNNSFASSSNSNFNDLSVRTDLSAEQKIFNKILRVDMLSFANKVFMGLKKEQNMNDDESNLYAAIKMISNQNECPIVRTSQCLERLKGDNLLKPGTVISFQLVQSILRNH